MSRKEIIPSAPVSLEKTAEMNERLAISQFSSMSPALRHAVSSSFQDTYGAEAFTKVALWNYAPKPELGPKFAEGMETRKAMLKQADVLDPSAVDRLIPELKALDASNAAALLGRFDKLAELDHRYKDGLPDAYITCLAGEALPTQTQALKKQAAVNSMAFGDPDMDLKSALRQLEVEFPRGTGEFEKMAGSIKANHSMLKEAMTPAKLKAAEMYFGIRKYAEEVAEEGDEIECDPSYDKASRRRDAAKKLEEEQKKSQERSGRDQG